MIEWPLEAVAASVTDIKVPQPWMLYFVYFENLFEPFQYFFTLLLIFIVFLWYISILGLIWVKYYCTICHFCMQFAELWNRLPSCFWFLSELCLPKIRQKWIENNSGKNLIYFKSFSLQKRFINSILNSYIILKIFKNKFTVF